MTVYLFCGDSLTEGTYGESYVEQVAKTLSPAGNDQGHKVFNAGRGCDTVQSLLERIEQPLRQYQPHWVILAIGTNDVWLPWLSTHSLGWRAWYGYRRLMVGQSPTTDLDGFAAIYRALIDKIRSLSRAQVLACTVSPVGEQLASPANRQMARLNGTIKHVAVECRVPVADIWQASVEALAMVPRPSNYVPGEWLFAWLDRKRLPTIAPDELSRRRRLLLTFDGIHLNSRGAELWANCIVGALARETAATSAPRLAQRLSLTWFAQGPIQVCCSPGWEARGRELGDLLAEAYEDLATLTGTEPAVHLAVLNSVHWHQSTTSLPYPTPGTLWEGESGTIVLPEAYTELFLREAHLPETLAGWTAWPAFLAAVGEPARAMALADLLAVQELALVFLRELRVAPTDPALKHLLAAYLTQVVLQTRRGDGAAEMAALWGAWGQVLARAGIAEGRVRSRARTLYRQHGKGLIASLAKRIVEG
jgi:lysophospholipase L1-like esterase